MAFVIKGYNDDKPVTTERQNNSEQGEVSNKPDENVTGVRSLDAFGAVEIKKSTDEQSTPREIPKGDACGIGLDENGNRMSNHELVMAGRAREVAQRMELEHPEMFENTSKVEKTTNVTQKTEESFNSETSSQPTGAQSATSNTQQNNTTQQNNQSATNSQKNTTKSFIDSACDFADKITLESTLKYANKAKEKVKTGFETTKEKSKPLADKATLAMQTAISKRQDKMLIEKFKNGRSAHSCDYRLLILPDEIMLVAYTGPAVEVKIPNFVNNVSSDGRSLPITAIHPNFLNHYSFNGIRTALSDEYLMNTDVKTIKNVVSGVTKLQLPQHLKYLPSSLFADCKRLKTVIIPGEVETVSVDAFKDSTLQAVLFLGKCPIGLSYAIKDTKAKIYCRKEFKDSYSDIPNIIVQE